MTTDYSPFTIRAPASTANFGSAFDAVGMALDLWIEVRVEPAAENAIIMQGEGADQLADAADQNLIIRAAALGASRLGVELPTLRVTVQNGIPLARGLGSSAAAIATGLLIANTLAGADREIDDMLADATQLEGHPDNAAPALMGGTCVAVISEDSQPVARQLEFPNDLTCIAFVPDAELSTEQARAVLPRNVPLRDASFNVARTALLIRAFMTHHWNDLALATEDRLHQPYRADLVPGMAPLTHAAKAAGAYTAFLSGAGPTILAMSSPQYTAAVATAMTEAAHSLDIPGRALILAPSERGAHVVSES